jgi:chemotaxis family two-component system response regulator Rcp1
MNVCPDLRREDPVETSARYDACRPLLIEDEPFYVELLLEALIRSGVPRRNVEVARDGEAAMRYLGPLAMNAGVGMTTLPSFVVLDLQLRRRRGLDVLSWMRSDPALKSLMVVVLTGTERPREVARGLELGVRRYLIKPFLFSELVAMTRGVLECWEPFGPGSGEDPATLSGELASVGG